MLANEDSVLLSDGEFNKQLDVQMEHMKNMIEDEKMTAMIPTIITLNRGNYDEKLQTEIIVLANTDFDETKYQTFSLAGIKYGQQQKAGIGTVAIFIFSEAWIRQFRKDEKLPRDGKVAGYADSVDAVITGGMTIDGRVNFGSYRVRRDKKGRIFDLKPMSKAPYRKNSTSVDSQSDLMRSWWRGYAASKLKKVGQE